ncbi:MAG: hypothetical protein DMF67_06640 [Acidobacteria bacterium]|nr:MAG: hypothetical protein DMF67_06640 [Acidobacteriota bacterium]
MREEFETVYERLRAWCRARGYAGHDPFDALNSRLFQATPLRRSRLARLAWTQTFKRSPVNLRKLARVPEERNPKGTALFALAELSRLRATASKEHEREARALLDELLAARIETAGGAAWGYNFDWQGRAFHAPRGTPAVVPTAFAARALAEAVAALDTPGEEGTVSEDVWKYLTAACRACQFILKDLNRGDETNDEVCFSYTPLDRTRVFNASLLAGEALASVGAITGPKEWTDYALRAARYVVRRQHDDGSWAYGADSYQSWADNFHTAFVLTSLARILRACESELEKDAATREEIRRAVARGYAFWRERFFLADGWPKYYHRAAHPADAHSAGAAVVALVELRELEPSALELAARVARWAVGELFDRRGFFYYQKRRLYTVRTPYMRWSQAWMMYALARLLEEGVKGEKGKGERG